MKARLALALFCACAETPFSPHRSDNLASDFNAVASRVRATKARPENALGVPLIAAVSGAPKAMLSVYDLAAEKSLYRVPADIRSRVIIAGNVLVAREGDRALVARDLRTGGVRWQRELLPGTFMGAASDGQGVYYVVESSGPRQAGSEVAKLVGLDAQTGSVRFTLAASTRLGTPAARNGLVFVPFGYQWLTVLDGQTGDELARIRNKEEAVNFVVAAPEGVFFGSHGVYRLDNKSVSGTRDASTYFSAQVPDDELRLLYHFDGYNAAQAGYTAYDRNRLLWIPRPEGGGFAGDVVLASYRFFFSLDAATGNLNWASTLPRADVMASAHTGTHVVVVTGDGDIVALQANNGAESLRAKLPGPVLGATIDARGFAPAGTGTPPDLREALLRILWDPDRRFEAVKLFALAKLGDLNSAGVTEDLISVVTHEKIDRKVYEKAGEALVKRVATTDAAVLINALATKSDYLKGTRARGIDMLAKAAGKLKLKEALEPLLEHFADPDTSPVALREIVRALDQIGSKEALGPFRQFLLTYRVDSDLASDPEVLRRVCDALLRLGIAHDRQLVRFVAEDPQTQPYLRSYARERLRSEKLSTAQ